MKIGIRYTKKEAHYIIDELIESDISSYLFWQVFGSKNLGGKDYWLLEATLKQWEKIAKILGKSKNLKFPILYKITFILHEINNDAKNRENTR